MSRRPDHIPRRKAFTRPVKAAVLQRSAGMCEAPGCDRVVHLRNLCHGHYHRLVRRGSIDAHLPLRFTYKQARSFIDEALQSKTDDCINWPFASDGKGYGQLMIAGKKYRPHRLICFRAHGEMNSEFHAAHHCGNRACCNPRHIRWATAQENIEDKFKHGTARCGEAMTQAILTEQQVQEIRDIKHLSQTKIGQMHGVKQGTISDIVRRKTWKHVD
jgi:hypothetical protein